MLKHAQVTAKPWHTILNSCSFLSPSASRYFVFFKNKFGNFLMQTMVTNVSSLLKTVRSVEDEAQRGIRAIESTVDAVKQAVIVRIFETVFILLGTLPRGSVLCP